MENNGFPISTVYAKNRGRFVEEIQIKARCRDEQDNWSTDGSKIATPEKLDKIQDILENTGCIILEHHYYRGSKSPNRIIFDEMEDFIDYLKTKTNAGDIIDVWSMYDLCTEGNRIAEGKIPDMDGCAPEGGAY